MPMHTVQLARKNFEPRTCRVRVTPQAVEEAVRQGFPTLTAEKAAERLARHAAVKRWFGRSRYWHEDGAAPHRGQVMQPSRGGFGADAVTETVSLHVS